MMSIFQYIFYIKKETSEDQILQSYLISLCNWARIKPSVTIDSVGDVRMNMNSTLIVTQAT